jgi:hypothetical protein
MVPGSQEGPRFGCAPGDGGSPAGSPLARTFDNPKERHSRRPFNLRRPHAKAKPRNEEKCERAATHGRSSYREDFRSWLRDGGYKTTTIKELVRLLASWTDWAHAAGFTSDTVLSTFDASKVAFTERRTGREVLNAAALFIRHLQDPGIVPRGERPTP